MGEKITGNKSEKGERRVRLGATEWRGSSQGEERTDDDNDVRRGYHRCSIFSRRRRLLHQIYNKRGKAYKGESRLRYLEANVGEKKDKISSLFIL